MGERILFIHGNVEWYGSDRALASLARALHDEGFDVVVGLPGRGVLADVLREAGIPVVLLDPAAFRPLVLRWFELPRYLVIDLPRAIWRCRSEATHASLVHVNTSNLLGGVLGGALARRPVVLHVRETHSGHEREWRLYCRLIRPFVSRVIATSGDIGAEVAQAGLGDRLSVIHDGSEFEPPSPTIADGLVVTVGRLNDWKGHDVLIEAVAILRERGMVLPLEIAGDAFPGKEHRAVELRDLARQRGISDQVRFLGYVRDVPALLDRAGIFVLPSVRPEPFGLALLDAMARGLACVATDGGGPREMICHGETGLLVPPGDPVALADAISQLWTNPALRRELGRAAAVDVRARFSAARSAGMVGALYRDMLTPDRGARPAAT